MPPVEYQPETLAVLRARLPKALKHVFDVRGIINTDFIRPGEVAANVFDFKDGLRLIISREQYADWTKTHVSASFRPNSPMADDIKWRCRRCADGLAGIDAVKEVWRVETEGRIRELFDRPGLTLDFIGYSEGIGIPHWFVEGAE